MVNGKKLMENSIKIAKEHKLEVGSVLSLIVGVYVVKGIHEKRRKEKGIPENYENDAVRTLGKCDCVEMAQ